MHSHDSSPLRRKPQRTCQGCRQVDDQSNLQRFALVDGWVVADPRRRLAGRGAWLHDDARCRELALRRGGFARAFRRAVKVSDELFANELVGPE
ncbi:YlxR family protein [Luteococcus sp. Sow4_B9]|uniref:YlxR family protein n=1 Tax=Luteococcus sp. Sow4_B9 TaxID=3438792 RepID=UPI003F94E44B